jgi:transcription elongation factor Elf1
MPLYVFRCPTHGRLEVRLPATGRAFYLCERCGQFCERDSTTLSTRLEGNSPRADATVAAGSED